VQVEYTYGGRDRAARSEGVGFRDGVYALQEARCGTKRLLLNGTPSGSRRPRYNVTTTWLWWHGMSLGGVKIVKARASLRVEAAARRRGHCRCARENGAQRRNAATARFPAANHRRRTGSGMARSTANQVSPVCYNLDTQHDTSCRQRGLWCNNTPFSLPFSTVLWKNQCFIRNKNLS
jgi:hypothetical protein